MGLTFHEESWVIIFLTNILMPKKDSKYTQSVDDLFTIVTTVKKNCPFSLVQVAELPGIAVVLFYFHCYGSSKLAPLSQS